MKPPAWAGLSRVDRPRDKALVPPSLLGPGSCHHLTPPPRPPPPAAPTPETSLSWTLAIVFISSQFHLLTNVVWVKGREEQKRLGLLVSPSAGASLPDSPQVPRPPPSPLPPPGATTTAARATGTTAQLCRFFPLCSNPRHHRERSQVGSRPLLKGLSAAPTGLGVRSV